MLYLLLKKKEMRVRAASTVLVLITDRYAVGVFVLQDLYLSMFLCIYT